MNDDHSRQTRPATRHAALDILRSGRFPTPNLVRERLGFGSMTTISDELKSWRQQFLGELATAANSAPAHWSPARIELCDRFFDAARSLERDALASERDVLHAAAAQQQQAYDTALASRDEALQLASHEAQQRQHAEQLAATLHSALDHERALAAQERQAREQALAQLAELRQQLARQQAQHHDSITALRAEQQQALASQHAAQQQQLQAQQHDAEQREARAYQRLEATRQQLMLETDRQRREAQAEKTALQQQLEAQAQQQQRAQDSARLRTLAAERDAATAAGEVKGLNKLIARLEQDLAHARAATAGAPGAAAGNDGA